MLDGALSAAFIAFVLASFTYMMHKVLYKEPKIKPNKVPYAPNAETFKLNSLKLSRAVNRLCADHAADMAVGTVALLVNKSKCDCCNKRR